MKAKLKKSHSSETTLKVTTFSSCLMKVAESGMLLFLNDVSF